MEIDSKYLQLFITQLIYTSSMSQSITTPNLPSQSITISTSFGKRKSMYFLSTLKQYFTSSVKFNSILWVQLNNKYFMTNMSSVKQNVMSSVKQYFMSSLQYFVSANLKNTPQEVNFILVLDWLQLKLVKKVSYKILEF